jgi:hypothetical protein
MIVVAVITLLRPRCRARAVGHGSAPAATDADPGGTGTHHAPRFQRAKWPERAHDTPVIDHVFSVLAKRSKSAAPTNPASISGRSSSPLLRRAIFAASLRKVSAQFAGRASTRCTLQQFYILPTHFVMNGARLRREVVTLSMSPSLQSLRRERPSVALS